MISETKKKKINLWFKQATRPRLSEPVAQVKQFADGEYLWHCEIEVDVDLDGNLCQPGGSKTKAELAAIGAKLFASLPAAAKTADGKPLHSFGGSDPNQE